MKISIIMPSFNQARFVEAALRSVIEQDYPDKEIILIDGGSTDGTMGVVQRHADAIAHCVSEPDKGQSDALRKGFERASGDVLTWLNTDDILLPGALHEVANTFNANDYCQWAFGNVVWIDAVGKVLRCRKGTAYWSLMLRLGNLAAYGPSAFFTRELYKRVGGINLDLHYMMDTELWWRFAISGVRFHRLKRYTWALRLHEDAKMSGHIFANETDPAQQKIARAKEAERDHIRHLTEGFRKPVSSYVEAPLRAVACAHTPGYVRGLFESWRWRGRHIDDLVQKLG